MLLYVFLIAGGVFLLTLGAGALIHGSVRVSLRCGISPLIIGLTVVAFGASAPELFVCFKANLQGNGDIAAGTIVGSNTFNIAVILSLTALIHPIRVTSNLIRQDIPVMIAAGLLFFAMTRNQTILRSEGAILFLLLMGYILLSIRMARQGGEQELATVFAHHMPRSKGGLLADMAWIAGGIGLLASGANVLIPGVINLAQTSGINEVILGLTVVAAGTALPELAICIVAAIKKEPNMAIGTIIGSNIFTILGAGGMSSMARPVHAPFIEQMDMLVMVLLAAVLLPLSWTAQRLGRREAALLLASYGAYLYYIWPFAH